MIKIGMRVIKTAIGAAIAIVLAQALGLDYPYSAAIIALLSIQDTRRKSFDVVKQRLKSTVLSLVIGSIMFLVFGFNVVAFGLSLLCFIPLTVKFNASEGISTSAVLVTHLLGEGFISGALLLNEVALMVVGTGVALMVNAYMPNMLRQIADDQNQIEEQFQKIIVYLTDKIRRQVSDEANEQKLFSSVKDLLQGAKMRANKNQENYVLIELSYYAQYMEMRFLQFDVLVRLSQILDKVKLNSKQETILANLTEQFTHNVHDANNTVDSIAESEKITDKFQNQPLPQTREEFVNQTLIFQYLNEFHHLLDINKNFFDNLRPEEKILTQALVIKESVSFNKKIAIIKNVKKFKKNLKYCYQKQLPITDPKVQELIGVWNKLTIEIQIHDILEEIEAMSKELNLGRCNDETDLQEYFKKTIKESNKV
ncbi:aromatic acid exporter family protein [Terrisporobacter petrolearius]|uniref:aromatic acid exporter family protein n=1 Tax=Terrisporobacter petrolearius TaxID=1460447 RepID=UPI003AFF95EA